MYTRGLDIKKVSNNFSNIIKKGRSETSYGSQFKDFGIDAAVNVMPKSSFNKSKCEVSNFNFNFHVFVFLLLKTNSFSINSHNEKTTFQNSITTQILFNSMSMVPDTRERNDYFFWFMKGYKEMSLVHSKVFYFAA